MAKKSGAKPKKWHYDWVLLSWGSDDELDGRVLDAGSFDIRPGTKLELHLVIPNDSVVGRVNEYDLPASLVWRRLHDDAEGVIPLLVTGVREPVLQLIPRKGNTK